MRRATLVLVACTVLAGVAGADEAAAPLTEEDRADLAFFARLGLPDVRDKPFVEVATGQGWEEDDGEVHLTKLRGFLLDVRDDGSFDVLTGEIFPRTFRLTGDGTPEPQQVAYRELDLGTEVRRRLAGEGNARDEDRFGERLFPRGELLALAWGCWRHGLHSEAHALLEAARPADVPLRQAIAEDLAESVIWRILLAFGEPEVSRPELLRACQRFLETFPLVEKHAETAREAAALLARMIEEDEAHAEAARPLHHLTREEEIAEWIFRLRDQNGCQMMQPGSPSVFVSLGMREDTPAHRLVAFGYDAVPQLIEALDDRRFTRTVGYWRDFCYSHYVVRIGDAAQEVLQRITGQSFWQLTYTAASMVKDGDEKTTKEKWQAWWTAFSEKGVEEGLRAEILGGGDGCLHAARQLLERDPDGAVEVLLEATRNATSASTRHGLIQLLAKTPGEAVLAFMRTELAEGPALYGRLLAARWLAAHGHPEGLEAITEEWQGILKDEGAVRGVVLPVATFFVIVGTEEAARIVVEGIPKLTPANRGGVLGHWTVLGSRPEAWPPLSPEAKHLYVATLAEALDDEAEFAPDSWTSAPPDGETVRVCEMAAGALAYIWRDEGPLYYWDTYQADRDRQIRALKNRWRAKQGLEPLPELAPPDLPRLGNRVRVVHLEPEGIARGSLLEEVADVTRGEITALRFAELVDTALRERPERTRGVEAVLWRPDDGTGIVLTLSYVLREEGQELLNGWEEEVCLRCGRAEKVQEGGSSVGFGDDTPRIPWRRVAGRGELLSELDKALSKPLDIAVWAKVRLSQPVR